jgi:hypothetical protein
VFRTDHHWSRPYLMHVRSFCQYTAAEKNSYSYLRYSNCLHSKTSFCYQLSASVIIAFSRTRFIILRVCLQVTSAWLNWWLLIPYFTSLNTRRCATRISVVARIAAWSLGLTIENGTSQMSILQTLSRCCDEKRLELKSIALKLYRRHVFKRYYSNWGSLWLYV